MEDDDDLRYIGECSKPENLQFRKDVEDILGRPYDEKEYETLWLQVNSRKPMQGYRELRGHFKAYSKDAMGKSYLDEYLDLRRKLDTFETDLPRKLSVLRGFFYYLKIRLVFLSTNTFTFCFFPLYLKEEIDLLAKKDLSL